MLTTCWSNNLEVPKSEVLQTGSECSIIFLFLKSTGSDVSGDVIWQWTHKYSTLFHMRENYTPRQE